MREIFTSLSSFIKIFYVRKASRCAVVLIANRVKDIHSVDLSILRRYIIQELWYLSILGEQVNLHSEVLDSILICNFVNNYISWLV